MAGMSVELSEVSSTFISPTTLYYLALYLLVIVIRFFKLKKSGDQTWDWRRVLYASLDIVYVSSGLFVVLLGGLHAYAPFIIIAYLVLIFISAQMESMEDKFRPGSVFLTHLVVIGVVVTATIYLFEKAEREMVGTSTVASRIEPNRAKNYRVIIPYNDQSMVARIGHKAFGARQLSMTVTVIADSSEAAKDTALQRFWSTVKPFAEDEDPKNTIYVSREEIVAQPAG